MSGLSGEHRVHLEGNTRADDQHGRPDQLAGIEVEPIKPGSVRISGNQITTPLA